MNIENKIKQKAQELREKYRELRRAQDDFYSAYSAEFGEPREWELLIHQGNQIHYHEKDYFSRLADLMSITDFNKQG